MKMFSSQEQPISTPVPLSLDDQLLKAQVEYESALAKQRMLEAEFQQKAPVVNSDHFQQLESNLRQQAMIVDSRHNALETLGKRLFKERQAEERKQGAAARAGQRTFLLAKLDTINLETQRIEELKRVPLDYQLAILNSERSAVLFELSTLKETTNAA